MVEKCVVKAAGVTKIFGEFVAVDHVNFEVNENEAIGIIGPNGAGKTTFLNVLSGYYFPEEGYVYFYEKDVTKISAQKRIDMGMMRTFQLVHVFDNLSVFENLALSYYRKIESKSFSANSFFSKLGKKQINENVNRILELFEILFMKDQLVGNLPLGSKKRLELAMAHIANPQVLLLDEPFAGLGDKEIDEISEILSNYIHKKTVIMVEHKISKLTNVVDKLAVMYEGKIIAFGPCEETLNDPEVRRSYWKVY